MRPASTVKRLTIAAAITGAAISATPALASAASTCNYNPSNKNLIVNDNSGTAPLRISRTPAGDIRIADGTASSGITCPIAGTLQNATVFNTERIAVFATAADATRTSGVDGYHIDQGNGPFGPGATPETDGTSEVEVQIATNTASPDVLRVIGTNGDDTIRVGKGAAVNLGDGSTAATDQDVDVTMTTRPAAIEVFGRGGSDLLSGGGTSSGVAQPWDGLLTMSGGPGADALIGSPSTFEFLDGGADDDVMFTADGSGLDTVRDIAGQGNDVAHVDAKDTVVGEVEQVFVGSGIGRLKLTPAAVTTRAGKPARVTLAWRHPKAWKQLRSLELHASAGGKRVATVKIDPARARVSGRGPISVLRSSSVRHHGKSVTADLRLRAAQELAGRTLRLEVQATDAHGHTQVEPLAGDLTVAE
ncbi:MAG TPA: hypothetical protein VNT03_10085 [Baekduia sp.]|nr:hypothetical protein [Baekduia sp.]